MWSRRRAPRLRVALAVVIFVAMLGIRIEPVPDDDDDPIVDYGPQLSTPLPARTVGAFAAEAPSVEPHDERFAPRYAPARRLHARPPHRRLHAQSPASY
jgi:hypothetical protein